jgi:predicted lipase
MYDFSDIRKFVDKHETTFNPGLTEKEKARKKIVAFDTPALVDTRFSADKQFPSTKMKNPVTAAAMKEFLDRNKKFIRQDALADPEFVYDGSNTEVPYSAELLGDMRDSFDADIIEFDDKFGNFNWGGQGTLVFSVIVNRSSKQIVVVFRGTYAGNFVKDAMADLNFKKHSPEILNKITDRNVMLHKGFSNYLLGENADERPQLDQIINILKEVYAYKTGNRDYSDYELLVTGHSLGGSLAQLCSYLLAGLPEMDFIPKPIKAVTYASPVVGDKEFFKSFQDLEKDGKIMHLRVSNKKDVIAGTPGMGIRKPFVQTGVNIHLRPGKVAEVKYENTKSILSQVSLKSPDAHGLYDELGVAYHTRLYAIDKKSGEYVNKNILEKTIEELYDEHAKLEN